jgi:putative transposase
VPVKKHSVEQIIAKLREIERLTGQGMSIPLAAKKVGVTDQTFYRWRLRYGALKEEEAKRLQLLEQENARLKRIVADQALDISMLRDLQRGKW